MKRLVVLTLLLEVTGLPAAASGAAGYLDASFGEGGRAATPLNLTRIGATLRSTSPPQGLTDR